MIFESFNEHNWRRQESLRDLKFKAVGTNYPLDDWLKRLFFCDKNMKLTNRLSFLYFIRNLILGPMCNFQRVIFPGNNKRCFSKKLLLSYFRTYVKTQTISVLYCSYLLQLQKNNCEFLLGRWILCKILNAKLYLGDFISSWRSISSKILSVCFRINCALVSAYYIRISDWTIRMQRVKLQIKCRQSGYTMIRGSIFSTSITAPY